MQVDFVSTALFSLAATLSLLLAAALTDTTLTRKYTALRTLAVWSAFLTLHFVFALFGYSLDITNDTLALLGIMILSVPPTLILYQECTSAKIFVPVMGALIANVTTFFFCGTTLSFISHTSNPYNVQSIVLFDSIKVVWFAVLYIVYRYTVRHTVQSVILVLGGQIKKYVAIPVYTFLAFFAINRITNAQGILPSTPNTRIIFILVYLIICSIFIVLYWEIFSTALWASRAHKTDAELSVASNIQRDMLPNIFPAFPEQSEFDIYATMNPAKEVGGDFYDFFLIDSTHLAIVIADVSGKGVPAALFMVIAKTIIRNKAQASASPADSFYRTNEQLCENNGEGLFVTAFLGIIDLQTGVMTYANAGHNPPLIGSPDNHYEWLNVHPGFVLAGLEGMRYREFQITLPVGSSLFLYTDGVTEATNAALELYGETRLQNALNSAQAAGMSPSQLLPYIKSQVDQFAKGVEQADDITMLSLKLHMRYTPKEELP